MSHPTFGSEFGKTFREFWESGEERDKEKRVLKRAKKARGEKLWGGLGGYSREAYERLAEEEEAGLSAAFQGADRGIEDPLARIRRRAELMKGKPQRENLSAMSAALARIQKGIEAEALEGRIRGRVEHGYDRGFEDFLNRRGVVQGDAKNLTEEQSRLGFSAAAGGTGRISWEQHTIENDIEATREMTNPHWRQFKSAQDETLNARADKQEGFVRQAVETFANLTGQRVDHSGERPPLPEWMVKQFPHIRTIYEGAGELPLLEGEKGKRAIARAGEAAIAQEKVSEDIWLKGTEADRLREAFINLTAGPPPPEGMKAVPSRKPWPTAIQGMIKADYAFEDRRDGRRAVHPRDKWLLMYRDNPKRFDLWSRYVDLTGKFPAIGTLDYKLERELRDIVANTTVMVTGLAANAVAKNSSLTEVGVAVNELIKGGSIKPNQRTAVVSMVMKEVRAVQFAEATTVGARERAYTHIAAEAHPGMSSSDNAPDGRPRWVIIMRQGEDEDGNTIMVGQHFPNPTVRLSVEEIKQINVRLNALNESGREGVPEKHTLESGKSVIIQKLDD